MIILGQIVVVISYIRQVLLSPQNEMLCNLIYKSVCSHGRSALSKKRSLLPLSGHQLNKSNNAGLVCPYPCILLNGFRSNLFPAKTVDEHPYGSLWKCIAALAFSRRFSFSKSACGGSIPIYVNLD